MWSVEIGNYFSLIALSVHLPIICYHYFDLLIKGLVGVKFANDVGVVKIKTQEVSNLPIHENYIP